MTKSPLLYQMLPCDLTLQVKVNTLTYEAFRSICRQESSTTSEVINRLIRQYVDDCASAPF